jgi:hypothetical protein
LSLTLGDDAGVTVTSAATAAGAIAATSTTSRHPNADRKHLGWRISTPLR